MRFFFLFSCIILLGFIKLAESIKCIENPKDNYVKLRNKLFCKYDREMRPHMEEKNLTVNITYSLDSFHYDEKLLEILLNSMIHMNWNDDRLKWNASDYENMKTFVVDIYDIWTPDLGSAFGFKKGITEFYETCSFGSCSIASDGKVSCSPACTHTAVCTPQHEKWPFDSMECSMALTTRAGEFSEDIILYENEKHLKYAKYVANNEWEVYSLTRGNKEIYFDWDTSMETKMHIVRFSVKLRRHADAEYVYVVSPALILTVLNLLIFWLDPGCTERIYIIILTMSLHFIYVEYITYIVPKTGDSIPTIVIFFRDSLVFSLVIMIETMLVRGVLCFKNTPPPLWMQTITEKIRGHTAVQIVFENPYLFQAPGNGNISEVEGQEEGDSQTLQQFNESQKSIPPNPWFIFIKIIDIFLFALLFIIYLIMIAGWLPGSREILQDKDS